MHRSIRMKAILFGATALGMTLASPSWAQTTDGTGADATASGDIIVTARRVEERLQDVPISMTVLSQEQLSDRNITNAKDLAIYTPSLQTNASFGSENSTFSIRGFIQEIGSAPTVGVYFADVVAPRGGGVGITFGDGAGPGSFFDLQNVQVLKGPQGTLQGRNTTGGAVMLVPQKPTFETEGYVEASVGNYNMWRLQSVLNLPINDSIRLRLGVDHQERDGYLINDSGIGPRDFNDVNYTAVRASLVVDVTPELENYTIASFSNSNTHGSFQKQIGSPCDGATFASCGIHGPVVGAGLLLNPLTYQGYLQLQAQQGKGFYHANQDVADPRSKLRQWQVINTTTWDVSDSLTVKNIISYAELWQDFTNPLFGSAFKTANLANLAQNFFNFGVVPQSPPGSLPDYAVLNGLFNYSGFANSLNGLPLSFSSLNNAPGIHSADQSTFTEEFRLQGKGLNERLTWQAGVYFESSKPNSLAGQNTNVLGSCVDVTQYQCQDVIGALYSYVTNSLEGLGGLPPSAVTIGAANYTVARPKFRDVGLYAQASYDLTDQLTATAGFRYTWDKQTVDATLITHNFITSYDYGAFVSPVPLPIGAEFLPDGAGGFIPNPYYGLPIPTPVYTDTARCTLGTPYDPVTCSAKFSQKSSAPTWMIDLEYKPSRDLMVYAKYSRGYRTGGVKHDAPLALAYFKPEKVDAYEVGLKSSFRGAVSGIFNAAFFYNKFSNQQIQLGLNAMPGSGLSPTSGPANAGKSRIWGIEADTTLNLFEGFVLNAGYTYLNTKLQKIEPIDQSTIVPYFVDNLFAAGDPLAYSPKNKFTVTGAYTLPLEDDSVGTVTVAVTFTHTDKMLTAYAPRFLADAGVLVNGPNGVELANTDLGTLPATDLLDINVNWKSVGGSPVDLSFFATNVTGEKYYAAVNGLIGNGFETASVGLPRMYGMRAKINF